MLITTKHGNGYENGKFSELSESVLDTSEFLYVFDRDGGVVVTYNGRSVITGIANHIIAGEKISMIFRASKNSDAIFAKVLHFLYNWGYENPNIIFDRPLDAYHTKDIPKVNSELLKFFHHENKINWMLGFSHSSVVDNLEILETFLPLVYKPANGSHGNGIKKIDTVEQLRDMADEHNFKTPMFLQEFYDKKFEYRVITWNGEVINFARKMLKTADGNQFAGRRFEARGTLHNDYVEYIRNNAKQGFLGIDITRTRDGRIIIIEENRAPEFESLDAATGKNTCLLVKQAMEGNNGIG